MISIMKELFSTSLVFILAVLCFVPSGRAQDLVVSDDYIVTGGLAVGVDGSNGEVFNFITMKLKENNVQLLFEDTDSTLSYPSMDWLLRANETTNGGANHFAIDIDDYVTFDTIITPNAYWIQFGCDVNPSQPLCSQLQPEDSSFVRNYHTPFTIDESAVDSAVVITADKMEVSTGVKFSNSNVGVQFVDGTAMTSANAYQSRIDSLETAIQAFETAIANAKASLSAVAISGDAADLVGDSNGDSAYDLWLADGNSGSESDYLASLVGATGAPGADGAPGAAGSAGQDGSSAHDLWVADGNSGSVADYLQSLKGGAFPALSGVENSGAITYFDGSSWKTVKPNAVFGNTNAKLRMCNGVPRWGACMTTTGTIIRLTD